MGPKEVMKIIISLIITVCMLFILMIVVSITTDTPTQHNGNETNMTKNDENKKVDIINLFFIISGLLGIGSSLTVLALLYYTYKNSYL